MEVFRRTSAGVSEATGGRHKPAVYSQFYGMAILGGEAALTAADYSTVLNGSGTLENVPAQTYALHVGGSDYESLDTTVVVERGQTAIVNRTLSQTDGYRDRTRYETLSAEVERLSAYATGSGRVNLDQVDVGSVEAALAASESHFADLVDQLQSVREILARRVREQAAEDHRSEYVIRLGYLEGVRSASGDVVESDVEAAQLLAEEISTAGYATDELTKRAGALVHDLRVRYAEERRKALEAQLARKTRDRRMLRTASWISLGVRVAGAATGLAAYLLRGQASAASSPPASSGVDALNKLMYGGIATAGGGVGLGLILLIAAPA